MKAGTRFASGGMRDRDVPHKPGHTNMNLGGGTITIAQMESCLAELAADCSGVLEMYDPYKKTVRAEASKGVSRRLARGRKRLV